jgi:hypothetical protein
MFLPALSLDLDREDGGAGRVSAPCSRARVTVRPHRCHRARGELTASGSNAKVARVQRSSGYMDFAYAESLAEMGSARELPGCRGWILERPVPDSAYRDAIGCYPLFCCADWSQLIDDVEALGDEFVSLTLVTDPFGDYDEAYLRRCFPDTVVPFKQHFVIDLGKPLHDTVSSHHQHYAHKALRDVCVEIHPDPPGFLDEWTLLHDQLVQKHAIRGIKAFSRRAFAAQLAAPGMVAVRVSHQGAAVAGLLFFQHGDVAYGHVLACTPLGYQLGALYAGIWFALEHFSRCARWCDIMGVPGLDDRGHEGLRKFKRGWTEQTRTAWLCGRILDRARYAERVAATHSAGASYFPAYRVGEIS